MNGAPDPKSRVPGILTFVGRRGRYRAGNPKRKNAGDSAADIRGASNDAASGNADEPSSRQSGWPAAGLASDTPSGSCNWATCRAPAARNASGLTGRPSTAWSFRR